MSKKRILIVDDEESVLFVLKSSLRKLGKQYEIATATNGFQALDELRRQPVDLMVTDYRMAGMDGLQLMEAVHAVQPDVRVILITAYGNETLEAEAKRLDAYKYLTKPLEIETFRRIVKEALAGDVAVSRPGLLILSDARYREIMNLLRQLQADVGGRCIILTDANGQTIAQSGDIAELQVAEIASLLSGSMATLQAAGQALDNDESAINLSYREGSRDNLYAINIGQQLLLILVIENSAYSSRLGSVWYYARQTAVSLRQTLGEAEYATAPQIFDDHMDEAFESELDKIFGEDDDHGLFAAFETTSGTADESPLPDDDVLFAGMEAPTIEKNEAAQPAPQPEPSAPPPGDDNDPATDELMSFADAVARGIIPNSLLKQE